MGFCVDMGLSASAKERSVWIDVHRLIWYSIFNVVADKKLLRTARKCNRATRIDYRAHRWEAMGNHGIGQWGALEHTRVCSGDLGGVKKLVSLRRTFLPRSRAYKERWLPVALRFLPPKPPLEREKKEEEVKYACNFSIALLVLGCKNVPNLLSMHFLCHLSLSLSLSYYRITHC